jgi:hypothetical protein
VFAALRKLVESRPRLTCAVITPVGPGHADLLADCKASVERAWRSSRGPFTRMEHVAVDDSRGELGRSRARNDGIRHAIALEADWLFFLDADDLMAPDAFEEARAYVDDHDALWGLIVSEAPGAGEPHLRIPQIVAMDSLDELLLFDPFLTLQMGHFVRAAVAREIGFNEALDAGEDFDYYLRLWERHRCAKVARVFFINRHSRRSSGPRSATAEQWGATVRGRQSAERQRRNLASEPVQALKNKRVAELQGFCLAHGLANEENYLELARQMPYRGNFDITNFQGEAFLLHTDNDDDVCARLAWLGEYAPLSTALWQALARSAQAIVDVGAGHGFYAFLAARAAPDAIVHCVESAPEHFKRLQFNIALNGFANVHAAPALTGLGDRGRASVHLVRIGATHPDSIGGIREMITVWRPDLLIAGADEAERAVTALLRAHGYRFYAIDDDSEELRAVDDLRAMKRSRKANGLASVRKPAYIVELARQAGGRPLNIA